MAAARARYGTLFNAGGGGGAGGGRRDVGGRSQPTTGGATRNGVPPPKQDKYGKMKSKKSTASFTQFSAEQQPSRESYASESDDSQIPSGGGGGGKAGDKVSKVTSKSLQAALQEGFIELVDAMDHLAGVLILPPTKEEKEVMKAQRLEIEGGQGGGREDDYTSDRLLRPQVQELLQTKGVQAVYWMQLMRDIVRFSSKDLAGYATAMRQRLIRCEGEVGRGGRGGGGGKFAEIDFAQITKALEEPIPDFRALLRELFVSYRKEEISLQQLEMTIEKAVAARDAIYERKIKALHIHYGKILDDQRYQYLADLEAVMMDMKHRGTGGIADAEQAVRQLDPNALNLSVQDAKSAAAGADVYQALNKQLFDKETAAATSDEEPPTTTAAAEGEEPTSERTKEKYFATVGGLTAVIPPKMATLSFPMPPAMGDESSNGRGGPGGVRVNLCASNCASAGGCCGGDGDAGSGPLDPWERQVLEGRTGKEERNVSCRFHVVFPQQHFQIPATVIDRFARNTIYKGARIMMSNDPELEAFNKFKEEKRSATSFEQNEKLKAAMKIGGIFSDEGFQVPPIMMSPPGGGGGGPGEDATAGVSPPRQQQGSGGVAAAAVAGSEKKSTVVGGGRKSTLIGRLSAPRTKPSLQLRKSGSASRGGTLGGGGQKPTSTTKTAGGASKGPTVQPARLPTAKNATGGAASRKQSLPNVAPLTKANLSRLNT